MKTPSLAAVLLLAGCAGSYKVRPDTSTKPLIAVGSTELIAVQPNGKWIWRQKPEEVVFVLTGEYTKEKDKATTALADLDKTKAQLLAAQKEIAELKLPKPVENK